MASTGPKHLFAHYIVTKCTFCDTVVFDYIPFPSWCNRLGYPSGMQRSLSAVTSAFRFEERKFSVQKWLVLVSSCDLFYDFCPTNKGVWGWWWCDMNFKLRYVIWTCCVSCCLVCSYIYCAYWEGTLLVAQLVEALRYKHEGRGFDSRWCHWNFHWHNPSRRTVALGSNQPLI